MLGVGNDLLLAAEHRIEGGPRRVGCRRGHLGDEVVRDDGVLLFAQHILQLGTLLDEMERRNLSTGLATLCVGAGMGTATIIERV